MTSPYGGAVGDARKRITDQAQMLESLRERHQAVIEANLARRAEVSAALQRMIDDPPPAGTVVEYEEADPIVTLADAVARATPCVCSAQRARAEAAELERDEIAEWRRQVLDALGYTDEPAYHEEVLTYLPIWRHEEDGLRTTIAALERMIAAQAEAIAGARALVDAGIAEVIESNVRSARADVRCIDCNLRYEERQDYGCHETGRGHSYDDGDLAAAEQIERDEPIEYVTLSVAALLAALATDDEPSESHRLVGEIGRRRCSCGWTPQLGESVTRAHDRHLLDVRSAPSTTDTEPSEDGWRCPAEGPHAPHDWRITPEASRRCAGVPSEEAPYPAGHGWTPGKFGGGCRVMLARYPCNWSEIEHDPALPPVDVDVFGYRRPAPSTTDAQEATPDE